MALVGLVVGLLTRLAGGVSAVSCSMVCQGAFFPGKGTHNPGGRILALSIFSLRHREIWEFLLRERLGFKSVSRNPAMRGDRELVV